MTEHGAVQRSKLLPCPFCGGAASMEILSDSAWVHCTECSSCTSAYCMQASDGPKQADPWRAREQWNRRESDAARFRALANMDAIAINQWLVQVRAESGWQSEYFATPPAGTPARLHATKLDALRAAVDGAIASAGPGEAQE